MNKYRTPILIAILVAIVAWYGGDWLMHSSLFNPLDAYQKKKDQLLGQIAQAEKDLDKAKKVSRELDAFRERSLPGNAEVARSLYRDWLVEIIRKAGVTTPNVDCGEPVNRKGLYQVLTFNVRGRGTLLALTKFLFAFYSTDQLHQIRTLMLTPQTSGELLDLQITVEALILNNVSRKDQLNLEKADRLASTSFTDYQTIAKRNLFGVTTSEADPTGFAYLNAIVSSDGQPEAWFTLRNTDTVLKLKQGDTIEVGSFKGTVAEIRKAEVILESDGERWLLSIGESLTRATALPPER